MKNSSLVEVNNLSKLFPLRRSFVASIFPFKGKQFIRAVDGISFRIKQGEVLGLAGESGCGKTTTGRLLVLLEHPTSGTIMYKGSDVIHLKGSLLKAYRRNVQMIFQDPYDSLNPRFTVYKSVCEPLICHKIGVTKENKLEKVCEILELVGLRPAERYLYSFPHQLSGGEAQRAAIARAIIIRPEFLVADEPVSMLDPSIRSGVMNLMLELKKKLNITCLFISHDLSVVRYMSDKIAVMYLGKIVEIGTVNKVIFDPKHPYTRVLISAVPVPDPTYKRERTHILIQTSVPDLISGCRFYPRCQCRKTVCNKIEPELKEIDDNHFVACHI